MSKKPAKPKPSKEEISAIKRRAIAARWRDRAAPPANAAAIIQKACENGCNLGQVAEALGVGRGKLREWLDKYPELQAAMTEGRQVEHDVLVGKLHELAMRGNLTAIIFALKARFGYREGEAPVQNTVSVNFVLPRSLTPEEYAAKVARESRLLAPGEAERLARLPEVRRELAKDLKEGER